jgi:hypothetical protein
MNQCRKLSCDTFVCKHFASYQGYPNYKWDLIWYDRGRKLPKLHAAKHALMQPSQYTVQLNSKSAQIAYFFPLLFTQTEHFASSFLLLFPTIYQASILPPPWNLQGNRSLLSLYNKYTSSRYKHSRLILLPQHHVSVSRRQSNNLHAREGERKKNKF